MCVFNIYFTKELPYNGETKPRIRTFNLLNGLIPASHFNLLKVRLRACSHYEIAANKLVDLRSLRAWLKSKWKRFTTGCCHYIESLYSSFIQVRRCIDLSSSSLVTLYSSVNYDRLYVCLHQSNVSLPSYLKNLRKCRVCDT